MLGGVVTPPVEVRIPPLTPLQFHPPDPTKNHGVSSGRQCRQELLLPAYRKVERTIGLDLDDMGLSPSQIFRAADFAANHRYLL